jgi:nucleoside-diphosphate-sugar epimerase
VLNAVKGVNLIYHLAAINGTRYFYEEPLLVTEVNVNGTLNILKAAHESGGVRVIFASSSEVYGEPSVIPTPEDVVTQFHSPSITLRHSYSASKFIGEILCLTYFEKYSLPVTIIRYFNVYGPRLIGTPYGQVVSIFINRVLNGYPPEIYGDGNQTRSFTYITDIIDGTIKVAESDTTIGSVLNMGIDRETTINELATKILDLCDMQDLKLRYLAPLPGDCRRRCPNIDKIKRLIDWYPKVELVDGLKKTIEWFKSQK